jgi:hypothetical protein
MSTIKVDTLVANDGTSPVTLTKQEAAKFLTNFNGTGTVATRDSLNQSSLADNGVGAYTVTYTNNFDNINYFWSGSGFYGSAAGSAIGLVGPYNNTNYSDSATTSTLKLSTINHSGTNFDPEAVTQKIHGDLA